MRPISNWENVKAAESYEVLPAGGYICRILSAREVANRSSAGTHLEISFDIAEGEYKDFFARDYRIQMGEDKYWHGTINQSIPLETSETYQQQCSFFRTFTDNVEASNPGYHWAWDETTLKGKLVGVVFGERERQSRRGTVFTASIAERIITVADVKAGKFTVPPLKRIAAAPPVFASAAPPVFASVASKDDDLPWA